MIKTNPDDAWNWGTLGDALMELGQYDGAAEAYQKMVSLRPNQSSYNRASYYRWVMGDSTGAIAIMQQAVAAGKAAPQKKHRGVGLLWGVLFSTRRFGGGAGRQKTTP